MNGSKSSVYLKMDVRSQEACRIFGFKPSTRFRTSKYKSNRIPASSDPEFFGFHRCNKCSSSDPRNYSNVRQLVAAFIRVKDTPTYSAVQLNDFLKHIETRHSLVKRPEGTLHKLQVEVDDC